jgi:hypothetical protein
MRMANLTWEKVEIGQCITFSLADMGKHENLLIVASSFWSDALNAFLFGNGSMTPNLLDVLMLTGLNISESDKPFDTIVKSSHQLATKEVKGWKGYITEHARTGTIHHREHTAFLNMWLEKFIFCGSTCGPTTNMQSMAERLASDVKIHLGKHLLGAVYHMLHQVSARLATNQPLSNIGGPWWFLQLWLNLYTHKVIGHEITQQEFPSDYLESRTPKNRRCTNFGKAVSSMSVE